MLAASVSVLDTADGFAYLTALSVAAFLIGAIAAGVIIRNRERIFVDTERRAAAAEADRVAEAERAVVRERSRIAREMHDVVAHSMSVVAVQAAAGREIVHADPDKAAEVFARIEAVGRESLTELRRMLGVLRDAGDEAASLSPQPGIADIAAAVAESSATGVATELVIEGHQRPLAPGVELTAFRIVQEALTNVRKHGGRSASATVRISYETDVPRRRGHRRRAWRRHLTVRGRDGPRPDRHARAGRDLRWRVHIRPATGWRLRRARRPAGRLDEHCRWARASTGDAREGRDTMTIRVAIVDDQALMRDGFTHDPRCPARHRRRR